MLLKTLETDSMADVLTKPDVLTNSAKEVIPGLKSNFC